MYSKTTVEFTNLNWEGTSQISFPKKKDISSFVDIDKIVLSDKRLDSLNDYTSVGYSDMNNSLRGKILTSDKTDKNIKDLNSLIDEFGTEHKNITLFKFTIIDKGFFSQTKDYVYASESAKNTGCLINIYWPNIKAIYTNDSEEFEVLANSGVKLVIDDIEETDDYIELSATGYRLF